MELRHVRAQCYRLRLGMAALMLGGLMGTFGAAPAMAAGTTIDTLTGWTGADVSPFGVPETQTYGQTFTAPAGDTVLNQFAFRVSLPPTVKFRAEVYAWDGTKATGSPLYRSGQLETTSTAYQTITSTTGGIQLVSGQQYVLLMTVTPYAGISSGTGTWAIRLENPYSGGAFFYLQSANPTAQSWEIVNAAFDLAFTASFSAPAPVGIVVSPTSGLTTAETGASATFSVKLAAAPTSPVTLPLSSSDATEGTVSAASLTFTSANWNTPQTVTITGVDDAVADGTVAYSVVTGAATSSDARYNGLNPDDVQLSNLDNDAVGVSLSLLSGISVSEAGTPAGPSTFSVVLNSQPTAPVLVAVESSDASEGTASPALLTFTSTNWNTPQEVVITGVDDLIDDGNVSYTINLSVTSDDPLYQGIAVPSVQATTVDDDTAGFSITPTTGLTTTEAGASASASIALTSQPLSDVTIAVSSSDISEGVVTPASLTFTPANWNIPRPVTVIGVNDDVDDGNIAYSVVLSPATSSDASYNGANPTDISLTNLDDDTANVIVTPISGNTTEAGGTATFTVVLATQPTANVNIALSSTDTTEGTVAPASLQFTPTSWETPQLVTVTGINDRVDDGDIAYSISIAPATSSDASYNGKDAADVSLFTIDDDGAGILVQPASEFGSTTEAGGVVTFTVRLASQPMADVTIPLSSSNTGEATIAPATLIFTPENWDDPQAVIVTGQDDRRDDGDTAYKVVLAPALSDDPLYAGMNAADRAYTTTDDDTSGVTITPVTGLLTSETGGTATFTVVLNTEPFANVTIPLSSSTPSEGTVSPAALTFTPANWQTPQTVTVTGVNDVLDDGDVSYTVFTSVISADLLYNELNPADVDVTNRDNDIATISVSGISGPTSESFGVAAFSVVLTTQPSDLVTLMFGSSDVTEGVVAPRTITFTPANWNIAQSVTVTGVDDALRDGDIAYSIRVLSVVSKDPLYSGRMLNPVQVVNRDNEPVSAPTGYLYMPLISR